MGVFFTVVFYAKYIKYKILSSILSIHAEGMEQRQIRGIQDPGFGKIGLRTVFLYKFHCFIIKKIVKLLFIILTHQFEVQQQHSSACTKNV